MSNMGHSDCFNEKALAHLWKKAQRGGRSLEHSKEVGHKKNSWSAYRFHKFPTVL